MLSPHAMERLIGWRVDERAIENAIACRGRGEVVTW
jgi:hypothetical protein